MPRSPFHAPNAPDPKHRAPGDPPAARSLAPLDRAAVGRALAGVPSQPSADEPPPEPIPVNDPVWQAEFFTRQRQAAARIPARFASKTLDNYQCPVKDKWRKLLVHSARAYISGFTFKTEYPKGLLMSGPVGSGKSHLAVAILKEVIAKGYTGLYYNSPDLMRDIRATFDRGAETREDDLLEEVTTTDLLVFDDVGAERMSDFVMDRFYLIINERYEGCKPVLITTNLDEAEMESRLGKRIVSRVHEMCETFGPFPDEDWRRKKMR